MSSYKEALDSILNSPSNKIYDQVLKYMAGANYTAYSQMIFPVDRASHIYEANFKNITAYFQSDKDIANLNDKEIDKRNEVLTEGMVHLHNYISSQFSLLDILKRHAEKLPLKNQLLSERKKLVKMKITYFLGDLRNNLLHQINFTPTLKFSSDWGHTKIAYSVKELLKSSKWGNSMNYILSFGDYLIIEDLIKEFHNHMDNFLNRYEAVLFDGNKDAFNEVLTTLLSFAKQYNEIGEKGFLPVSEQYLVRKLKFLSPN